MFTYILYILAVSLLVMSFFKDSKKTKAALIKAWKAFENILPQFLGIIVVIGLALSVLNPGIISKVIGSQSGFLGMIIASLVGAVTLIPGFVAFPLASVLLNNGAGLMQIAVFVSTLMMVGVITIPIEVKYFGTKVTVMRNSIAFVFSFIVALLMGVVLKW